MLIQSHKIQIANLRAKFEISLHLNNKFATGSKISNDDVQLIFNMEN